MRHSYRYMILAISVLVVAACVFHRKTVRPATTQLGPADLMAPSSTSKEKYPHRRGALTDEELKMAQVAWKYFENNWQAETGLVNAVQDYPSTTMWDTASYLGGLTAAESFGLITKQQFDGRMRSLLKTLNTISLFRDELPNKVYQTKTGEKVNYANGPGEIGFSALDLGRLMIWLQIIKGRYPEHANAIDSVVLRWDFSHVIDGCGTLYGALLTPDKKTQYVQEGRLGYEEYSAKGFQLWGFSTCLASRPEPYNTIPIYCVEVPYDTRDPRALSQHNYVVSESYVLDGIELDWTRGWQHGDFDADGSVSWSAEFARRIYQVQENRFHETGVLTARSEHQLAGAPYFVYDTIYSDGYAWNTITEKGEYVPKYSAISLKAALGLWALWQSDYTDLLYASIAQAYDPQKGYFEGIFENGTGPIRTFTANNNGIMLEALMYKNQGRLLRHGGTASGLWEQTLADPFAERSKNRPVFVRVPDASGKEGSSVARVGGCRACTCPVCQDDQPVNFASGSYCPR